MGEKKRNQAGKESMSRRHPVRHQLMAVFLGVCLAVVSVPVSQSGYSVQAAELQQETYGSFGLPEELKGETVSGKRRGLPEDAVTSDDGKEGRQEGGEEGKIKKVQSEKQTEGEIELLFVDGEEAGLPATPTEPGCGIVSEDTTWTTPGELTDGELIVMPGVTLTICGNLYVSGTVAVKGGGTITRGENQGGFEMREGANLAFENITLDGCSESEYIGNMISLMGGNNLTLGDGCVIRDSDAQVGGAIYVPGNNNNVNINGALIENCTAGSGFGGNGGAICVPDGYENNQITLNNATIRNCSAGCTGGAISASGADVTINGGRYENNRTVSTEGVSEFPGISGGGFIYICKGTLTVNDGIFIGNSSVTKGGCICHCGHEGTRTYIYGGTFSGNTCSYPAYVGSGALYNSAVVPEDASVTLSGSVRFSDGVSADGTDGIYLDAEHSASPKIQITDTLTYPITLYLKAVENYEIAEGVDDYRILKIRDMKKIHFVDVGDSGETWYAVLNEEEENNYVYLSTQNPGYHYFVYYNKNGAGGAAVTDDNEYDLEEEVTVKSAEGLYREGYVFAGWNTKADGTGIMYREGDVFTLKGDTDLYAIFVEHENYSADFYSGSAGNRQTLAAVMEEEANRGTVTAPQLQPMEGFAAVGWDESTDGFDGEISAGEELTLTGNAAYYGVYEKEVTLSYDANGGEFCPESKTNICRANVSEEVSYDVPIFTAAAPLPRTGYVFAGWNTEKDGTGQPIDAGENVGFDSDTTLYAMWVAENYTPYRIEHYKQDVEGNGYTRVDADTEYMAGQAGSMVVAEANPYIGFTRNTDPKVGKAAGIVEADGSLVLQLYYDRDVYGVEFDLNGGEGTVPKMQSVRYGGLLQEVEEPQRRGYTFKGWYLDREGTESAYWDIYRTVEENTKSRKTTLYAKWADETAPVLGEASFEEGYSNFADWVIGQKKLVITVPVTEEGSGLKQGDYSLEPENGKVKTGTALIRVQQAVASEVRGRSGGISAVMTIRGNTKSGESVAVITIAEEFKGSVSLTCTDNAGNTSVKKILTADGAGAIVEDNAPDIRFSRAKGNASKNKAAVNVDVTDSAGDNVTAGIAAISYRIDGGEAKAAGQEEFADSMVENYRFTVEIEGEGKHTLQVTAADNAGNESTKMAAVEILKSKADIVPNDKTSGQTPKSAGGEPKTGETTFVKIFATLGMVAGFTYLLLYFASGDSGITEREKEQIISRLVRWARKGKFRKYPALIIISLFLVYYHSIGKSVGDEWRKVCES